jgi:hypothetical protein
MHPAYGAMLAQSHRTQWPETFRTDLTKHDREALARTDESIPLFWVLRRDGTFLCEISVDPIDGVGHFVWHAPAWFPQTFGPGGFRFYTWDGATLREHPSDVEGMRATLEEMAHERRDREQAAKKTASG